MKSKTLIHLCLGLLFLSFIIMPSQYGIENPSPIDPFLNNVFPEKSPSHGFWKAENAFPNLTFTDPIAMVEIPEKNYYYVAGKPGLIWLIENDENTTVKQIALDIQSKVITSGDAGLINIVLHPEFSDQSSENQGFLYVNYAFHPTESYGEIERMNRLSRFKTFEGSFEVDPESEFILIQDYDPQGFHMGGGMFFDDEGFLYLTIGDGGVSHDAFNSSQQIRERLWGGMIRIDVDNDASRSHPIRKQPIEYPNKPEGFPPTFTQGYMIPNDNPWLDEGGSILEEFFGIGLRSPHRATFDPVEQKIWIGDVGQALKEEINVMTKGGNAQWPYKEGSVHGPKSKPDNIIGEEIPPIYEYGRSDGTSIIGGFVYRGDAWYSYLDGLYIFGDHGSRNIWSFNPLSNEVLLMTIIPEFGENPKSGISSFATNEEGDIFVLNLYGENLDGGVIYKLVIDEEQSVDLPELLSETGAFTDLEQLIPAPGIIPYDVNSPLWSDGAIKKRWIAVANDGIHDTPEEKINLFENADWQFPIGTVFIKHFDLPTDKNDLSKTQKVETRFFIIDENGRGYGLTYKWNDAGTDAVLLEENDTQDYDFLDEFGQVQTQAWEFPSRTQCLTCHTSNAEFILGVKTWQLNSDYLYPSGIVSNQLATWNHLGMFAAPIDENQIENFPQAVSLSEETGLQQRVSSYLDANCSHCHRPNGVEAAFDARFSTPMAYKNLINTLGVSRNNPHNGFIVFPGEPESSQLWIRDNSLAENKMPPIAKSQIDQQYIEVLTEWIEGLKNDCSGIYLSDFQWNSTPQNGFGPVEIDQSVGDILRNDGSIITIDGKEFQKGLGVHAYSEISYLLDKKYKNFNAFIGVDDGSCNMASVQFEIYCDDVLKYQSPIMNRGEGAKFLSIDIKNVNKLTLKVTSPFDDNSCDHANWAAAKLIQNYDSDGDGVCDDYDLCPGADDKKDDNNDGIPDDCEKVKEGGTIEMIAAPNPFRDYVEILLKKPDPLIQKASLIVYDLNGRLLYQNFNVAYDHKYRFGANWHAGIYIIKAKAGSFENEIKIIKHN